MVKFKLGHYQVTLTFEDGPNGQVKCTANPTFETLLRKAASGHEVTSAEAFAMLAMTTVREQSKKNSKADSVIEIPKPRGIM